MNNLSDLKRWPAESVENRSVASLVPYAKNARQHSKEQIRQIAASITEFGFTIPVLIDEAGGIIAGHGRVLAAKLLKLVDVPCMIAKGWSDAQRRAYVIADNKLALASTWDDNLLKLELTDLAELNFNLDIVGFEVQELADILAEPASEQVDEKAVELTDEQKAAQRSAWRILLTEWRDQIASVTSRDYITPRISKGTLAVEFVSALNGTGVINRGTSCCYTPHRLGVAGDKFALLDLFDKALKLDNVLDSIIWSAAGTPTIEKLFFGTLAIHGHRLPADFPADLALSLIDEFCKKNGAVLDPCHGWGGRALGFLLSTKATSYVGFDVDARTNAGVEQMIEDLSSFVRGKKSTELYVVPFEDSELKAECFDFALTSPPYFDVEKYEGELSSWKRYPTLDEWAFGFYAPLITKTAAALKKGAYFCLQIGNQSYPLEKMAKEIASTLPLKYVETRSTDMRNNQAQTSESDGEVIVIFKKTS